MSKNKNNPHRIRGKVCREMLLRMVGQFPNLLINPEHSVETEKLQAELWSWIQNEFAGCGDNDFYSVAAYGFGFRTPVSLTKQSEKS